MNFLDMLVVAQERGWRFRRKDDGAILWIDRGNLMLNGDVAECDCGLLYGRFTPIHADSIHRRAGDKAHAAGMLLNSKSP